MTILVSTSFLIIVDEKFRSSPDLKVKIHSFSERIDFDTLRIEWKWWRLLRVGFDLLIKRVVVKRVCDF